MTGCTIKAPTSNIAWLAGILDGEGCIAIQCRSDGRGAVFLTVNTTCPIMADKICSIYKALNVQYNAVIRENKKRPGGKMWTCIRVTNIEGVATILEVCREHLTTKFDEAIVMLEFIDRLPDTKRGLRGSPSTERRDLWADCEQRLKSLKKRRIGRDNVGLKL
jgi:hypothetical protein